MAVKRRSSRFVLGLALVVMTGSGAMAQTDVDMSHFEVASVKLNKDPAHYQECTGGPGKQSPTLWICNSVGMGFLIPSAFGLDVYQYLSRNNDAWSISARLPAG